MSRTRVAAVLVKELREYRRNSAIVGAMSVLPLVFVLPPLIDIFAIPARAARTLSQGNLLIYLLGLPAIVPAALAAYSVVGEREQGTLEPMLTTPIRRDEFLLGKALAAFLPAVTISYVMYGLVLAAIALFAQPGVAGALIQGRQVISQLGFTPLIAGWSIWVGMAISARSSDVRVAQQLSTLASLPTFAVAALTAYGVIHPTVQIAAGLAIGLFVLNRVGLRAASLAFDRERLISSSR